MAFFGVFDGILRARSPDAQRAGGRYAYRHHSDEKGRLIEKKRALAAAVTEALTNTLDMPPEWVNVLIEDVERENWATGGRLQLDRYGPGYGKAGVTE